MRVFSWFFVLLAIELVSFPVAFGKKTLQEEDDALSKKGKLRVRAERKVEFANDPVESMNTVREMKAKGSDSSTKASSTTSGKVTKSSKGSGKESKKGTGGSDKEPSTTSEKMSKSDKGSGKESKEGTGGSDKEPSTTSTKSTKSTTSEKMTKSDQGVGKETKTSGKKSGSDKVPSMKSEKISKASSMKSEKKTKAPSMKSEKNVKSGKKVMKDKSETESPDTVEPTLAPSVAMKPDSPSSLPSAVASLAPSVPMITLAPSVAMTPDSPSSLPSDIASLAPSVPMITLAPSVATTLDPPSSVPSDFPSLAPSVPFKTLAPSVATKLDPSEIPSSVPSDGPSLIPSAFSEGTCDPNVAECCADTDCSAGSSCVERNCVIDGSLRFTLSWVGSDEKDLELLPPNSNLITFMEPLDPATGGMHEGDTAPGGVEGYYAENVYFPVDRTPPAGIYVVGVKGSAPTSWTVTVELNGFQVAKEEGSEVEKEFNVLIPLMPV